MKIIMTKISASPTGVYNVGDKIDISEKQAKDFIKDNAAIDANEKKTLTSPKKNDTETSPKKNDTDSKK